MLVYAFHISFLIGRYIFTLKFVEYFFNSMTLLLQISFFSGNFSVDGMSVRAPDTNIVTLQLNQLTDPAKIHAGDPVLCSNSKCTAVMSHLSTVNMGEDQQVECYKHTVCACNWISVEYQYPHRSAYTE